MAVRLSYSIAPPMAAEANDIDNRLLGRVLCGSG
jgi:hypothetical protein